MPEEDDEMIDMRKAEEETEQECEEPDEAEESTRIKKQKIKDKILEKVKFAAPPDPLQGNLCGSPVKSLDCLFNPFSVSTTSHGASVCVRRWH